MKTSRISFYLVSFFFLLLTGLLLFPEKDLSEIKSSSSINEPISEKKKKLKFNNQEPGEFLKYYQDISTKPGHKNSNYPNNYRITELKKAIEKSRKSNVARQDELNIQSVDSHGPGNIGGRTRAILIDPNDNTNQTWFAAAASGGIWKTTDRGTTWQNLTPDLPNLSTNSLAMSVANTDVIYAGTGEVFAGNFSFVRGDGIFKSTDKGITWQQLQSTINNNNFNSVNRIVVNPADEDVVVIATNTGVFKSIDGGVSWSIQLDSPGEVQDLVVNPNDFNVIFAGVKNNGIFKSVDAGETWLNSSDGISAGERFEIAISPTNTQKVYTSTYRIEADNSETTLIYKSINGGDSWALANLPSETDGNYLGGQGWYDNTIAVHPFDEDIVFVGGVYLGKYTTTSNFNIESQFFGVDLDNAPFISFVNFEAEFFNGQLAIGDGGDNATPSTEVSTVEIRFGAGRSQKAHRFSIPSDGGSNGDGGAEIPDNDYAYEDYVDVPFEVWDIDNNKQLMVSFRDQGNDGTFDLNERDDTNDPNLLNAREYVFIHNIDYNETTPDGTVTTGNGQHLHQNMYFFWPILESGQSFPPSQNGIMRINIEEITTFDSDAEIVADPRGDFGGDNINLHADHHHLTMIPINAGTKKFHILNGNDGGLGYSDNEGATWKQITDGYVTTQFYGADKNPEANEYVGGMQDNGTWISPEGNDAIVTSNYTEVRGGDGFEVIWHSTDPNKIMGGSQFNGIAKTTTGQRGNWQNSTTGISNPGSPNGNPFITRLAGSVTKPDVVYAIGANGVYKTTNFGDSWDITPITVEQGWTVNIGGSPVAFSQHDVEVSLANDNIIWAGAGMSDGLRRVFVSLDGGDTFDSVRDFPNLELGALSGIATHPTDENTAYILFSFAGDPKVLRTTDLGQTWEDISGFLSSENSTNGFPDVFVHSLLVLPNNPDVIWAGTEIGLFQSTDNGVSWSFADIGLPAVSIWSMKVVGDRVVIGTHGRGIWSVQINDLLLSQMTIQNAEYLGNRQVQMNLDLPVDYDEVTLFIDGEISQTFTDQSAGLLEVFVEIEPYDSGEDIELFLESSIGTDEFSSSKVNVSIDFTPQISSFVQSTEKIDELISIVEINEEYDSLQVFLNQNYLGSIDNVALGNLEVTYTIQEAGNFETSVIGYYGELAFESDAVSTSVSSITSINDQFESEQKKFHIFPNPAQSVINFETSSFKDLVEVNIIDRSGKNVFSKRLNLNVNTSKIDISSLKKGVYILQLNDGKRVVTDKFIKR